MGHFHEGQGAAGKGRVLPRLTREGLGVGGLL